MFSIKTIRRPLCYTFPVVFLMLTLFPTSGFSKMVGPYTGQVLDSRTGEPIQGASVLINWVKSIPTPAGAYSELIKITLANTDDHGIYKIPRQFINVGLIGWLGIANLIVYQPGYQVSIQPHYQPSINRQSQKDLPPPFKKTAVVKLEQIPPGFDHKKHHDQITDALHGFDIDDYEGVDNITGRRLSTKELVDKIAIMAEYWEFMRRIEWEKE